MAAPSDATLKSPHVEKKTNVIINEFIIGSFFLTVECSALFILKKTKSLYQMRLYVVAFAG